MASEGDEPTFSFRPRRGAIDAMVPKEKGMAPSYSFLYVHGTLKAVLLHNSASVYAIVDLALHVAGV